MTQIAKSKLEVDVLLGHTRLNSNLLISTVTALTSDVLLLHYVTLDGRRKDARRVQLLYVSVRITWPTVVRKCSHNVADSCT